MSKIDWTLTVPALAPKTMLPSRFILVLVMLLCGLRVVFAQEQWIEIKSPHFNLLSNGGEQRASEAALQFEQMRSVFAQIFFKDRVDQPVPLQIIALKNQKQLSDYAPLYQGKPVNIVGFYLRSQDRNYIVLDLETPNRWQAIFHEYTHLLLDSNLPDAPTWFSEGFAQFCSTISIVGKKAILGRPPQSAAEIVSTQKLLPVDVLFNVDHSSPVYNDDHSSRTLFYAQSWLAVDYLWANHRMDAAWKYLELVRRHVPVNEAMNQAFQAEAAGLDQALEQYSRTEMRPLHIALPEHLAHVALSITPVESVEGEAALADLHAHQDDYRRQSVSEFRRILEKAPDNATAQRGLGYALFIQHHTGTAMPYLQKAAASMPRDWAVHYYLASAMAQTQDDVYAPAIEKEARIAVRLNPEMADSHGLLGFALMTEHKFAEAASAYEIALRLKPESEAYALNLAELYIRQSKFDQARPLFSYLQNSQNWYIAAAARSHLAEIGN